MLTSMHVLVVSTVYSFMILKCIYRWICAVFSSFLLHVSSRNSFRLFRIFNCCIFVRFWASLIFASKPHLCFYFVPHEESEIVKNKTTWNAYETAIFAYWMDGWKEAVYWNPTNFFQNKCRVSSFSKAFGFLRSGNGVNRPHLDNSCLVAHIIFPHLPRWWFDHLMNIVVVVSFYEWNKLNKMTQQLPNSRPHASIRMA